MSGGDQRFQAAKLESGKDIALLSGGTITFEGVKDLHQESHEKSRNGMAWSSAKGRGNTDETLRQSEMIANGNLVIHAVEGLNIDIKDINQNTVSQTIDAMVSADPNLTWLKDAEKRGDVDWRLVKETHDSFKYSSSGMGPAAMLAVIIIVSVLTAGAASTAVASASASLGATGSTMAAATTATAATGATAAGLGNIIATSILTSMASTAATSTINSQGNLGNAFKDVFSSESLKGYALAGVTAGIAAKFGFVPTELKFDMDAAQVVAIKASADALARTAIMGGSLKDNLVASALGSAISISGAVTANKIGDITVFEDGKLSKVVMHAALGGLMAEAMGGDFRTGAIAAGANEALVDFLAEKLLPTGVDRNSLEYQQGVGSLLAASQLVGVLTAAVTGGDAAVAAVVTANGTQYNNLNHSDARDFVEGMSGCEGSQSCQLKTWKERGFGELSDELFEQALQTGGVVYAKDQMGQIAAGLTVLNSLECTTQACSDYKFLLTDRALKSMVRLGDVVGQWEPVLGAIAGIAGGLAGFRGTRPAGLEPVTGSAQINKAYAYWKDATREATRLLPKPGSASLPASGVGAGVAFKVDSKQLGKKLGKHVEDFGGKASNPVDRKMVLDKIHDVGANAERVVPGTFAGQGANGARGDVFFRIKGNDVVVTKPDGTFVTILKDGVTQNASVQDALKGGVRQ